MIDPHHGSPKEGKANVDALPHGLLYMCEQVSGQFHKND